MLSQNVTESLSFDPLSSISSNSDRSGIKGFPFSNGNKGLKKPTDCQMHPRTHLSDKMFKCKTCPIVDEVPKLLKIRMTKKHPRVRTGRFCQICGKLFGLPHDLKKHMQKAHQNTSTLKNGVTKSDEEIPTRKAMNAPKKMKVDESILNRKDTQLPSDSDPSPPPNPIRIRQCPSEDPKLWPKVVLSRHLNDLLSQIVSN